MRVLADGKGESMLYPRVESALAALNVAPHSLQLAQVEALTARHYPNLSPDRPALIGLLRSEAQFAALAKSLLLAYSHEHEVSVVLYRGDDLETQTVGLHALRELSCACDEALVYVPPLPCPGSLETFLDTVAHLRSPDGCPWDREQTHRSLRQGFQEEAYEVLDALDREDVELLEEELGDVLLHILLQAQIAAEQGEFRMSDVVCRVNTKLVYRHPHVFGGLAVSGVDEILVNWEELKQREKGRGASRGSSLDGIAPGLPALARAQSIQRHVDRTGAVSDPVDVLVARARAAFESLPADVEIGQADPILGDLLFDLANLARKLDVDLESSLREANTRFEHAYRR